MVEVSYSYNINQPEPTAEFLLKTNANLFKGDILSLCVLVSFEPILSSNANKEDVQKQSNMTVLEIALPSGFVFNTEVLNRLKNCEKTIKRIETKKGETLAVIYLDYVTSYPLHINVDAFREHEVDEQKPAAIVIYDYYDNCKYLNTQGDNFLPIILNF